MRTAKLIHVMLESMTKELGTTPAMLISWMKISFYQGCRVFKQLIPWVFDESVLCLYKLFFQAKTLQMRHSIVSVHWRSPLLWIVSNWSCLLQRRFQVSPAGYKLLFAFLFCCWGFNFHWIKYISYSCYIIFKRNLLHHSKGYKTLFWSLWGFRHVYRGTIVSRQTKHKAWLVLDGSVLPQVNSVFLLNFLKFRVKPKSEVFSRV